MLESGCVFVYNTELYSKSQTDSVLVTSKCFVTSQLLDHIYPIAGAWLPNVAMFKFFWPLFSDLGCLQLRIWKVFVIFKHLFIFLKCLVHRWKDIAVGRMSGSYPIVQSDGELWLSMTLMETLVSFCEAHWTSSAIVSKLITSRSAFSIQRIYDGISACIQLCYECINRDLNPN